MPASVDVVELGLCDGVVDVDGGEEERASLLHLVEAVDAGGDLLADSNDALGSRAPAVGVGLDVARQDAEDALELCVVRGARVGDGAVALKGLLGLDSLVDEQGHVTAIVDDHVRSPALLVGLGPGAGRKGALPVLLEALSLPCVDSRDVFLRNGSRGLVLGGEDVARGPADVGAELLQGLDQDCGLDRHVQRSRDADTSERLACLVLTDAVHEAGHLVVRDVELLASKVGERDVSDLVWQLAVAPAGWFSADMVVCCWLVGWLLVVCLCVCGVVCVCVCVCVFCVLLAFLGGGCVCAWWCGVVACGCVMMMVCADG